MKKIICLFLLCFLPVTFAKSQEQYPFKESYQRAQFQRLLKEFRCLVCQNQDLADSNATLAKDLKTIIYDMILDNKTDVEIKKFLTTRYGDFVLFSPPVKQQTYLLWFGPFLMLFIAIIYLFRFIIRSRRSV